MLAALAWLPLAAAACLLARGLWQALPLRGGARWLAGLALALLAALALPAALAALPRWLIPARWSDVSFWSSLGETLRAALFTLTALRTQPATARSPLFSCAPPPACSPCPAPPCFSPAGSCKKRRLCVAWGAVAVCYTNTQTENLRPM